MRVSYLSNGKILRVLGAKTTEFYKFTKNHLFLFVCILELYLRHMEVPRLGVKSKLQLLAYTIAKQFGTQATSVTYTRAHSNVGPKPHL